MKLGEIVNKMLFLINEMQSKTILNKNLLRKTIEF